MKIPSEDDFRDDPKLWDELYKAYDKAYPYRAKVQFRKDILCMPTVIIDDAVIFCTSPLMYGCIASAYTNIVEWHKIV